MFSSLTLFGVQVLVYRDDLNHATVSGNKLHKLIPNIELAKARGCSTILSYGGPYSNHLHALAWACKEHGLSSIGVVRGELQAKLTPTLLDCKAWGMRLVASTRKDYREQQEILALHDEPRLASELSISPHTDQSENILVLPEGGSNLIAIESINEAYARVFSSAECQHITHAVCSTGTGATLAGLRKAAPEYIEVIGIQAVAEGDATLERVHKWLDHKPKRLCIEQGHLDGFGKMPAELLKFIDEFEAKHGVPLDPIYNGKSMLKLSQMIEAGRFKQTDKILFINTGGLQGKRSSSNQH